MNVRLIQLLPTKGTYREGDRFPFFILFTDSVKCYMLTIPLQGAHALARCAGIKLEDMYGGVIPEDDKEALAFIRKVTARETRKMEKELKQYSSHL